MKNITVSVRRAIAGSEVKYLDLLAYRYGSHAPYVRHDLVVEDLVLTSRRPYSPSPLCPPMAQVFGRTVINRVK